jgi:hypothetical protein
MYRPFRPSLLVVVSLLLSAPGLRAQSVPDASGHWEGQIQIPGHLLTVSVDMVRNPAGTWIGSLTIPHSATTDVPLDVVTVAGASVQFAASLPGKTSFDGSLSPDGRGLSGTVSNAEGGVPFQLSRTGDADVKMPPPSSPMSNAFEGTWEGTLETDSQTRRVQVKLAPAADGTATATIISVDKGNLEVPVTTVTLHDRQLQLEARAISGTYRGTLGADGTIAGEWSEGGLHFPLMLKHVS